MNLNEFIDQGDDLLYFSEEMINEGLTFFKKSKSLRRYAKRLMAKVVKAKKDEVPVDTKGVESLIKGIEDISDKFEQIERDFGRGKVNRTKAKKKIHALEVANEELIAKSRNSDIKRVLGIIGGLTILASLIPIIPVTTRGIIRTFGFTTTAIKSLEPGVYNFKKI